MVNLEFIYHYTNIEGWNGIRNGHSGYMIKHPITGKLVESETVKGWMLPHRRVVPEGIEASQIDNQATSAAIFGLTEPTPKSWINYKEECEFSLWDYLLSCCRKGKDMAFLLKIKLAEEDNPLVLDYSHIRKTSKDLQTLKGTDRYKTRLAEGHRDYWNSRVKLSDYQGNFTLPEVVIFNPIPLERISFVKKIKPKY